VDRKGLTGKYEIGEFWNKDTQIDVVGNREDNVIDLSECKFGNIKSPGSIEKELNSKVQSFPNRRNATFFQYSLYFSVDIHILLENPNLYFLFSL